MKVAVNVLCVLLSMVLFSFSEGIVILLVSVTSIIFISDIHASATVLEYLIGLPLTVILNIGVP